MEVAITLSAVITPMTEKTPMATPSMVSPERSLFVLSAVSAMRIVSFIAKRLDGVEARGRDGRRQSGEDAGDGRDDQADDHQTEGERHRERWEGGGDGGRHQPGEDHSDCAADEADRDRLDQELQQDGATPRADG